MTKSVKIVSFGSDLDCLLAHRDHIEAPSQTYGVMYGFSIHGTRTALLRRYSLCPSEARFSMEGFARLTADLAAHDEAQALGLDAGEFFGLQISAWRNRHQIAHNGILPLAFWSVLDAFALYRRSRAVNAKRRDEAQRIEAARLALVEKYAPHREVQLRDHSRETVH